MYAKSTLFIAAASALLVAACASPPPPAAAPPQFAAAPASTAARQSCIPSPDFKSNYYSVIDNQHLVVRGNGGQNYLLTLVTPCATLDDDNALGFSTFSGSQLCVADNVVTKRERCSIGAIEPVANNAAAKALVTARKTPAQPAP